MSRIGRGPIWIGSPIFLTSGLGAESLFDAQGVDRHYPRTPQERSTHQLKRDGLLLDEAATSREP